ncbi:MAG TPA: TetR/AcrR family transcriptional regulator [Yinghuangia sp.]|uniref:TetR/AcrR family transcriptional regulator n=1 Tax=Yinghuangia sp. YIM S10712 TaxID=3436930 RepID=UPI002B5090DF|nr:TetR/AcrR family transcriptional regulator [Yinghuangia sp.]
MTSTGPSRTRGTYARTAERRRTIARAVLDLVLEKGHAGVTTAETAARAGTSEATVLYHFPTRDHLLVAALRRAYDEDEERMPPGPTGLDLDRLRRYATGVHREVTNLDTALAGHAGTPGHPAREFFAELHSQARERWTDIIAARQETGLAHPGLDPSDTARQFLALWNGLRAQWLVDPTFDLGETLVSGFRRLTGQNWMEARGVLLAPDAGL